MAPTAPVPNLQEQHSLLNRPHPSHCIAGLVKVVPELPPWLQGDEAGSYDDLWVSLRGVKQFHGTTPSER